MAKFESKYRGLVLQDADGVWARFENGEFETDDRAVADRLRAVEYVTEVEAPDEPPQGEPSESWKADALKAYAAEHGIDLAGATKKADIVAAITAATSGD